MKSFLEESSGIFDNSRKFAVTNITNVEFVSAWDGHQFKIPPHATVEMPHYLAVKVTGELVDKIMTERAFLDTTSGREKSSNSYYRSPLDSEIGIPAKRKFWEDKIVVEIKDDETSAQAQVERVQIAAEIKRNLSAEVSTEPPPVPSQNDFAQIRRNNEQAAQKPKKELKLKTINALQIEAPDAPNLPTV